VTLVGYDTYSWDTTLAGVVLSAVGYGALAAFWAFGIGLGIALLAVGALTISAAAVLMAFGTLESVEDMEIAD